MVATVLAICLQMLVVTWAATGVDDCDGPECNANDAEALLQAKVSVEDSNVGDARIIETVDDIDMVALGLLPEHLDKETTKIIEGVPIFNYDKAYDGNMNPSLLEQSEARGWIVELPDHTTDGMIKAFCDKVKANPGNAHCEEAGQGHPSEGGQPFAVVRANHRELQEALKGTTTKPAFIEPDVPISNVPEIDETEHSASEVKQMLLETEGKPASWGLDRIDDAAGLDNDFKLPAGSSGGKGAHVYVADTGIRVSHSDFEGRAVPALEAHNGLKECSATDKSCAADKQGHGTHCAGTIGGKQYGVAKNTALYAVKVLGDNGQGSFSGIIRSVDWVATKGNKPAVWSASLGGRGKMHSAEISFQKALKAGVVVSVAAGNNRGDACGYTPAFAPTAITVGASSHPRSGKDPRAGFSNYGKCVDLFAPGYGISSASHRSDTGSARMSGTSMACPHVSGAAAVFLGNGVKAGDLVGYMRKVAINGIVTDAKGSPNLLLYVGTPASAPKPEPAPTDAPTKAPTPATTKAPTDAPTKAPTPATTKAPTPAPTQAPTMPPPPAKPTMPPQPPQTPISDLIKKFAGEVDSKFTSLNQKIHTVNCMLNGKLTMVGYKLDNIRNLIRQKNNATGSR